MRRRDNSCKYAVAIILLILGAVFMCFVSWRFMLFLLAAILILIGIILIRKC